MQISPNHFWGVVLGVGLGVLLGGCSLPPASSSSSVASSAAEDQAMRINLKMEKHILPNGLTVILVEDHRLPIIAYHTLFKVGSSYENERNNGVSHFLEHMMFKKTSDLQDGEFDRFIEEAGGYANAGTSFDQTTYYEQVPREFLPQLIKYEAGRMSSLALEEATFNTERQVVLEERRMRYENNDGGKLYLNSMSHFFHNSPYYARSVIGTVKSISELTQKQMQDYYQQYYAPNNAILTIVGDIESREVLGLIKEAYGPLATKDIKPLPPLQERQRSTHAVLGRHFQYHGESTDPVFVLMMPGLAVQDPRVPAWDMVANILAQGASSYLNQRYVYSAKPSLRSISLSSANLQYDGLVRLSGTLMPTTNWPRFQRELARDMHEFCTAIDQPALEKAKNQYRINFYTGLDTNLSIASLLTIYEADMGDYQNYAAYNQKYLALTLPEVQFACQEIFAHPRYSIASIWKNNQEKVTAVLPPAPRKVIKHQSKFKSKNKNRKIKMNRPRHKRVGQASIISHLPLLAAADEGAQR